MGKHSAKQPYILDEPNDLDAWQTHEIRSHRRAAEHSLKKALFLFGLAALAAGALNSSITPDQRDIRHTVLSAPEIPLSAPETSGVPQDTPPIAEPEREAERASRDTPRKTPPPAVVKIEQVIAYALAQQGDRYSFGAAGPNSFDCSGLVMAAFKQVGINLPHYTGTMIAYGTKVTSRGAMVRGDIIFLASNHVGLYLGNGMMVAASSGQGKVTVQKVYAFYAARRLL